jgi:hypothetical protein
MHLPAGAGGKVIGAAGYTGVRGATDQDFRMASDPRSGTVSFVTTKPLGFQGRRQGLRGALQPASGSDL